MPYHPQFTVGPHTLPQREVCLFKVNVANKDEEAKESEGLSWKMLQEKRVGYERLVLSQVSGLRSQVSVKAKGLQ